MGNISASDITKFIEENIPSFHQRRLASLGALKLREILKRKNPYLFKAKNVNTAGDLVTGIISAHLSSQEETIFGDFLEKLAIFICAKVFGGRKSAAEGIDLEFERAGILYIVSIKSGPNWGNSSQINKMKDNFRKARRILGAHAPAQNIVAINGCCYGREGQPEKGEYVKYCGQQFWQFISGQTMLYTDIIEPLGHQAKERNEAFDQEYAKVINRFTRQFIDEFCHADGTIVWDRVVKLNSATATA